MPAAIGDSPPSTLITMVPFGVVMVTVRVSPAGRAAGCAVGHEPSPTTSGAEGDGLAAGAPNGLPIRITAPAITIPATASRMIAVLELPERPLDRRRSPVFGRTPVTARLAARFALRLPVRTVDPAPPGAAESLGAEASGSGAAS